MTRWQGFATASATFILLMIRGFLLWLMVPLGALVWLVVSPAFIKKGVTLGRFLGWLDWNLVVGLQRALAGGFPEKNPWIPPSAMKNVEHRIRFLWFA